MTHTFCATAFTLTSTSLALGVGVGICLIETSWATLNLVAAFHRKLGIPRSFVANARIVEGAMARICIVLFHESYGAHGVLLSVVHVDSS